MEGLSRRLRQLGKHAREAYPLGHVRNLIERPFSRLRHWRRIASGFDRKSIYFPATLQPDSSVMWD